MELFKRLYEATKEQEEAQECPLFICGMFVNTCEGSLDIEVLGGGAGIIDDNDELHEFLQDNSINPADLESALRK